MQILDHVVRKDSARWVCVGDGGGELEGGRGSDAAHARVAGAVEVAAAAGAGFGVAGGAGGWPIDFAGAPGRSGGGEESHLLGQNMCADMCSIM